MADEQSYTIRFNRPASRLEVRLAGFWDADVQQRFVADFAREMDRARAAQRFGVLFDANAFPVQAAAIAEGFTRLVDSEDRVDRAPVAVVINSALLKMQAVRSITASHLRLFDNRPDAMVWLDSLAPSYRVPHA